MSLHYEWILSLDLKADTPVPVLAELRWHLGLDELRPIGTSLGYDYPVLGPSGSDWLPGGAVAVLRTRTTSRASYLSLFARTGVSDDDMYEIMQLVPSWLARWCATQGWIGLAREEMSLEPWLYFYVQEGFAYVGSPGEQPAGLQNGSPNFTLTGTLCL